MAGDDNEIKYFILINYNFVIVPRRECKWCTYGAQRILLPRGTAIVHCGNNEEDRVETSTNGIHLSEWNIHVRFQRVTALSSHVITDTLNMYMYDRISSFQELPDNDLNQ